MAATVTGLSEVLRNLNRAIQQTQGNTRKGLSKAGLFIKAEAVERAPAEYGTLRGSAFSQISSVSRVTPSVKVGFTADYAPFVHEMPMKNQGMPRLGVGKSGTYWSNGENKFLEKAVKLNLGRILSIIRVEAARGLTGTNAR